MNKLSTKKIVLSAMLMALTTIATMFIRIPLPFGYVNLGDVFVFLSVFILGAVWGTVAAGVGSAIADLIGYAAYAPGTLIIKSLMALLAFVVYKIMIKITKKAVISEFIGGVVGAVVMALGYFVYEILFFTTPAVAITSLPWNIIQGAVGIVLSVILMRVLTVSNLIEKTK